MQCITSSSTSNQIFHFTRRNTPRRVTSWRGPSPRHCARATPLLSKKCYSGGEPLVTLCSIWPARDLNLRPSTPETNPLPLDQLAGFSKLFLLAQWNKSHNHMQADSRKNIVCLKCALIYDFWSDLIQQEVWGSCTKLWFMEAIFRNLLICFVGTNFT